jgi:hypothetical protein
MENKKLRVYLDNCCYNRPFDNQNQRSVQLETQAKLWIQDLIKDADYFITTDKRVLKYQSKRIKTLNPIEFLRIWEGQNYDE